MSNDFREVHRHLPQITIARACSLLGDAAAGIDSKDRLRILDYLAKRNRYDAYQVSERALRASQGRKKVVPVVPLSELRGGKSVGHVKEIKFSKPGPPPEKPECPDIARVFLNALGTQGLELKTIRNEVEQIIIQHIDTFTVDDDGIRGVRLTAQDYNNQHILSGMMTQKFYRPPWTAKRSNGTYGPVMMNKADLDYLIQHGHARLADEPVLESPNKSKGGALPGYHWDEIIGEGARLIDELGPPHRDDDDPEWRSQNGLIIKLQTWYAKKYGSEPSRASIQKRVQSMYEMAEARRR